MGGDLSVVRGIAVLKEVNPLPGAQTHLTVLDRNAEADGQKGGFDMGGHVVRAFERVAQIAHAGVIRRRDKAAEIGQQITLHIRVGIFLDQQRGRGVAHHQRQKPIAVARQPPRNGAGDLVQRGAIGVDLKRGLHEATLPQPGWAPQAVYLVERVNASRQ